MDINNARLAPTIKRVAKNVADIVKRKNKLQEMMIKVEADCHRKIETKLAKYKEEYDALNAQQELFEAPIRSLTGGYGTEDLIKTEVVETGVDKNGKPTHSTRYVLKYPDTIIPPAENPQEAVCAEIPIPTAKVTAVDWKDCPAAVKEQELNDLNELPFS